MNAGAGRAKARGKPTGFAGAYGTVIRIALVGGVFAGVLESAWTLIEVGGPYARSAGIPWGLFAGLVGRSVLSHGLMWTVLSVPAGVPIAWFLSRSSRRDPGRVVRGAVAAVSWCAVPCFVLLVAGTAAMIRTPFGGAGGYHVAGTGSQRDIRAAGPPNILWIVMDTVRADRLSCYGYERPTSPFLESLASESAVYDRAFSSAHWTVPAHASMFTGLPVRAHGSRRVEGWLDEKHLTIAELLGESGYACAMFSNNPYLVFDHNFDQGFEFVPQMSSLRKLCRLSWSSWFERLGVGAVVPWLENDGGAAMTNSEISRWLDGRRDPDRPFLLFVNYMDAHMPYQAPRAVRRMFMSESEVARSYRLRRLAYGDILEAMLYGYNLFDAGGIAPKDLAILRAHYDASIRYVDGRIEELLSMFGERRLLENTMVVVTSDHGEQLGEREQWAHEFGLYDSLVRVPLLIRHPGAKFRGRVGSIVQTSDLFATMAGWAGATIPAIAGLESNDLSELRPSRARARVAVSECLLYDPSVLSRAVEEGADIAEDRFKLRIRAVVWGDYKFIRSSDGRHELYNLAEDPAERDNLFGIESEVGDRLAGLLDDWLWRVPEYVDPTKKDRDPSPEFVDQIKALGYMN